MIVKASLYSLCLTSKTFNLAATPYLYENVTVGYRKKETGEEKIAWLSKFGSLPPSLLRRVKSFTVGPIHQTWHSNVWLEMSEGVEKCLAKMTRLESFT